MNSLIERNEVYPRTAHEASRTAKQLNTLLESFFARSKDDPISEEKADESEESLSKIGNLKANYRFGDYGSYKDMLKYLRTIEFHYPHITKLIRIGETHEGVPIEGLKIGYPVSNVDKRAIWIDGNIHAREWATSHTALYFINQLISKFGNDQSVTHYLNSLNIYIFPCLNPDGYEYTRSRPIPQVRLWRKNRSPQKCIRSLWGGRRCCEGVDLNRNFDFYWAEIGSSDNPCSHLYHGESAFSEPETRAVKDFLLSPEMKGKLDGFITLHTYAQLWIHPYSHKVETYPENHVELARTAKRAVDRLKQVYGTEYRIGTGANILAPASGGSDDWAKDALGVRFVYLLELRPELELINGFILHKKELIPTAVETWEGVRAVIDDIIKGISLQSENILLPQERIPMVVMGKIMRNITKENLALEANNKPRRGAGIARRLAESTITIDQEEKYQSGESTAVHYPNILSNVSSFSNIRINGISKALNTENNFLIMNAAKSQLNNVKLAVSHKLSSSSGWNRTHGTRNILAGSSLHNMINKKKVVDPNCRNIRISCRLWVLNNPNACKDRNHFMREQCKRTCKLCPSLTRFTD
ncbi:unnamed protein product [Thelazia callipaeda]|uniref:ShKT domain-containing protein n=1 Tax=Thelazia callipaeda TaxID=103827 RepID=A0A0N5CXT1_THECL|nr:unnamed protein product [Thelazia callipaeda]